MTTKELRESVSPGYNLAAIVPATWSWDISDFRLRAVPVLSGARGALGVLRALDLPGRMPGIQAMLADSGNEARLIHCVFLDNAPSPALIHDYRLIVSREA